MLHSKKSSIPNFSIVLAILRSHTYLGIGQHNPGEVYWIGFS